MFFDAKFFTALAFIVINFLILFVVKTRTTTVTSLIMAHLIAVLFFSLTISNYNSFKEIVLALIIYSMVILFLISNYNSANFVSDEVTKIKAWKRSLFFYFPLGVFSLAIFLTIFSLAKTSIPLAESMHEKKFSKQSEIMLNPMILPSHPVHIAVKTYYLGRKFEDDWSDKVSAELEINERKRARLKDKLSDNFLLKRSSDVILIIVAVATSLLLLSSKRPQGNS